MRNTPVKITKLFFIHALIYIFNAFLKFVVLCIQVNDMLYLVIVQKYEVHSTDMQITQTLTKFKD